MNIGMLIPSETKARMDALIDFLLNFYGPMPYIIVFGILLACGLGVPIPEDITLVVGGVLAYYGVCDVWVMIAVCLAGVMIGDSFVFWLGAKYGRALTKKWFFHKVLPDDRLDAVQGKFKKYGNKLIFAARFMPGLRAPIFFSAGVLHLPFSIFFSFDGIAALLSVPAIVGGVYIFGDEIDHFIRIMRNFEYGILAIIVAVILFLTAKWYHGQRKALREGS
jgi:membrane protein DedA with SNARE-associated domain